MSIESDLDAFRDLALEEQVRIPYYMSCDSIEAIFDNLDPLLDEIIFPAEKVALSGVVFVSGVDQNGDILINLKHTRSDTPIIGYCNGVDVGDRTGNLHGRFKGSELVVGYCVSLPYIPGTSELSEAVYAFAPVETSQLYVPELVMPFSDYLPETDDPIAQQLDEALLGEQINLDSVIYAFEQLRHATEMQRAYYLKYLTMILPISRYELKVVTDKVFLQRDEESELEEVDLHLQKRGLDLGETDIWPTGYGFHQDIGLCVVEENQVKETKTRLMYPINKMYKIDFQEK